MVRATHRIVCKDKDIFGKTFSQSILRSYAHQEAEQEVTAKIRVTKGSEWEAEPCGPLDEALATPCQVMSRSSKVLRSHLGPSPCQV